MSNYKFVKGNTPLSLSTDERLLILELLDAMNDPEPEEKFLIERLKIRMKGYRVAGTKWDKSNQERKACKYCEREIMPHMLKNHQIICMYKGMKGVDKEFLARV